VKTNTKNKLIALIPARSGSQRLKNKNILKLKNKHLLGIAIEEAVKSKLFSMIIVSSDSKKYLDIAGKYGKIKKILRPSKYAKSSSPDFEWVNHSLNKVNAKKEGFSHFFILRPSNPFRKSVTIKLAWKSYLLNKKVDSLRAVQLCKEHPGKMWTIKKKFIVPFINKNIKGQPIYNNQYKVLPEIYIQNACIEISKIDVIKKNNSITGKKIMPFFTKKFEGADINYLSDFNLAKKLIKKV